MPKEVFYKIDEEKRKRITKSALVAFTRDDYDSLTVSSITDVMNILRTDFYYYFKDVLYEKKIKLKDVYLYADVSEAYGSKIITMEKHTKNRDLIIRLCLAGHFTWDETNRALKLYGMTELYAKDPRDACLIVAINHRKYDINEVNEMLIEQGMDILSKDEQK